MDLVTKCERILHDLSIFTRICEPKPSSRLLSHIAKGFQELENTV
jgi:hypothetical protein